MIHYPSKRIIESPDHPTIDRRVNRLNPAEALIESSFPETLAVDVSGVKAHYGGNRIRGCERCSVDA
ncbi:MAG: hypothetical protein QW514_04105 [Thermoprotei archaeon]